MVNTGRKPPQDVFGTGYSLQKQGKFVYLCDEQGGAITVCNLKSVAGRDFKKTIRERTGLSEPEVNVIVAQFLLRHQKRGNQQEQGDKKEKPISFDECTTKRAWQLVRDPLFFWKLGKVFDLGFVVPKLEKVRFVLGEDRNKRLVGLLLVGASRLNMATITKLLGEPGTAKDTIVRMWLVLLPSLKAIERSYFTAAALRYSQEMQLADLLYIPDSPELRGEMGRQLRFMRSDDGGLISEYATKDQETGEMTTKIVTLPIKAIVTTSNAITGDPALESGMWTLSTNGSKDLTDDVKREKLKLRAGRRTLFPEDELEVWKCAFHILLTEEILETLPQIPFAESLFEILESDRSTSRRDPDKLCDLIALVAWFRRFQKEPEKRDFADFVDLCIAFQIGLDAITQTMSDLDEKEALIFEAVKQGTVEEGAVSVTIRDVTDKTRIPYETSRRYLDRLVGKGFLNMDKDKNRNVYSLLEKNMDKKLVLSEMRRYSDSKQLTEHILNTIKNSSIHHEVRGVSYFDPLTGEQINVTTVRNDDNIDFVVKTRSLDDLKINDALYPLGELRRSELGMKKASEQENNPNNPPIDELVTKNKTKNGSLGQLKCKNCNKNLDSDYFKVEGAPVCDKCFFAANPRTCPVCRSDMPQSQLSSINGKIVCSSCVKKLEAA